MFIRLPSGYIIDSARLCYVAPLDSSGNYRLTLNVGEGYNATTTCAFIDAADYDALVSQLMDINKDTGK